MITKYAAITLGQARRIGQAVQAFEGAGRNKGVDLRKGRSQPAKYRARITAVSGSFPQWSYTVQRLVRHDSSQSGVAKRVTDGINLTGVLNDAETPGTAPYTYGNGITITSSSGQCNSTACVIQPIGVGACVDVIVQQNITGGVAFRAFSAMNSGQ